MELDNLPEYSPKELLELEKVSLGFYVSGHPLDEYKEQIEKINYTFKFKYWWAWRWKPNFNSWKNWRDYREDF